MSNLLSDFKKFIMQGDLVSLAVAIIIGLAFKTLVDSLVNDVIMPFVARSSASRRSAPSRSRSVMA